MEEYGGFWQFSTFEPTNSTTDELNDHFTFWYGAGEVIVRLVSISPVSWQSTDGFYRLQAKWNGNKLSYLNPVGQWHFLASAVERHFQQLSIGRVKVFKRVAEPEIASWNKAITDLTRPLFNYSLVST